MPEHNQAINRVEEYSLIDPEDLLPKHQYLLDTDFEALGSGPTIDRQIWLANITSACAAARLSQAGTLTPDAVIHYSTI
jgi:rhamnose utilization protein RhaD (predicted bifunctional aldolase and dehydrogenase)